MHGSISTVFELKKSAHSKTNTQTNTRKKENDEWKFIWLVARQRKLFRSKNKTHSAPTKHDKLNTSLFLQNYEEMGVHWWEVILAGSRLKQVSDNKTPARKVEDQTGSFKKHSTRSVRLGQQCIGWLWDQAGILILRQAFRTGSACLFSIWWSRPALTVFQH